ncbi:MAG: ACP S-malonyltransferase [Actinomycetota bacterium]|nr:ACP S-malonyltransferase [Actinomycetota bacterium]MDA8280339.1 ACP S-malonyltransferase [Actinomycetota bacterium]
MLAFTFPGQGSQRPGMGRPWVDHPSWEVVSEASAITGRDLQHLLLDADQHELTETANAQMATFVLSSVVLDAIERVGLEPMLCAGHSLGEYTALAAAGALGFEDGVRLVAERGAAMHEAADARPGTMAAVLGADDDSVDAACRRAEGAVWVANYNAPGQVVIAGERDAVERAGALAKELGARKVLPIPVAGAFHTELMAPARDRLRKALAVIRFAPSDIPVVANVDARAHQDGAEWPALLSAALCNPVRWRQTLAALADLGATVLVEVGSGGVLTGLARRALPDVRAVAISGPDDLDVVVDAASGTDSWHAYAAAHQGERMAGSDRVVVAPATGVFQPEPGLACVPGPGALAVVEPAVSPPPIGVGDAIGTVGTAEVRSPFGGAVLGFLVHPGERVVGGQPVAWLRAAPDER